MQPISAVIITRDEANNIVDALRSVEFCDELLVVDSGSVDDTVSLAQQAGARVLHNQWPGHVAQKNFAIDNAAHDWILSIDADERISDELATSIKAAMAAEPAVSGFEVSRRAFYLGRWIDHCGWYPDRRVRLFDRRNARWEGIDPHDFIRVQGPQRRLEGDLLHYTYRDISHHLAVIDRYTTIGADRLAKLGRRATINDIVGRPIWTFFKKYVLKLGVLDGLPGLLVCALSSYYVFLKYAKLWERGRGT
ncbi:MAG: glycosyltransferase family 2 protein [Candidatus Alcyoniella australis]|nr:glycosyltransferase family 2 protein [Candidatus Alcyoniella australis]